MPGFAKRWFGSIPENPVSPFVPDQQRVYCVGDIHGRFDLLQQLRELILTDSEGYPGAKTLVYLGDYIDRGEQSRQVIDSLIEEPLKDFNTVFLLGNHEQTLLDFLDHPRAVAAWLSFGGRAALHSYGIATSPRASLDEVERIRDELEDKLPERHLAFFQSLELMHSVGSYCFVHAGIRPGIAIQEQRNDDLLWIREEFTQSSAIHEQIIVHGHTVSNEAELLHNRIGIDTGAYASGVLTCLVLEGETQRLLQTNVGASLARENH